MKAALLTAIEQYEIRELPDPIAPSDGLVLQVKACGVCGSDLRRWREGPPQNSEPVVGGHEISGDIIEIGDQVSDYQIGDRLAIAPDVHCGKCYYCQHGLYNLCDHLHFIGISAGYNGGLAEKIVLDGEILKNGIVHRMPAGLSYLEGALAEPCSSVLACHDIANTSLEDFVVVMGAGPIGCIHVCVAKSRGARVLLSEPNPIRQKLAEQFHPDIIVDPSKEDLVAITKNATNGKGADVVICANPVASTHQQAIEIIRKRGNVVLFGGLPKLNPMTSLDANKIHYGEIKVTGSFSYHPTYHELALEIVERKIVAANKIITHQMSIDEINQAFLTAASGEALKVIILP